MKLFRFVFVLAVVFVVDIQAVEDEDEEKQDHEGSLTDYFAVELDQDDENLAREVAKLHGFEYAGRIGSLPGHFQLVRKSQHAEGDEKRGEIPYPSLHDHPNVKWHEQQRELFLEKRGYKRMESEYLMKIQEDEQTKRDLKYFSDPKFHEQWYINSVGQVGERVGSDMGILKVWKKGYTGKGVVVTVMDDGLDHRNKDLKKNFDPKASKDLNDNDDDPQPRDAMDQYHGTKCSGEIAADPNDFCGVGIAPHVKIGGVRMLDGKVTGITEAGAFGLKPDYIDIYSASWGPKDNGKTLAGPSKLGMKAIVHGVNHGRNGKGSIYVWASGNGGASGDDCGCDGYASSIYTMAIGSASPRGRTTYYDEKCASTMAVVYSGDDSFGASKPLITTARGENGCIEHFGGTSAAAPMAVGVFALVLQANKDLTWRDLQHLVAMTSKKDTLDMSDPDWKTNGAGFKVNHKYGFGLLYAPSLIKEAKRWKTVSKQLKCVQKGRITSKRGLAVEGLKIKKDSEIVLKLSSDACKGKENHIKKLEHVQVVISLRHRRRGVLSINIRSPAKTNSKLLSIRPNDDSTKGVKNWPFMSVHFWGEDPAGEWKLTVRDNSHMEEKRIHSHRRFDESEKEEQVEPIQERSKPDLYEVQEDDQPMKMPFRHEVELEDENEYENVSEDESEDEGRQDFTREEDDTKLNIFDVRSNVYGELESWTVVMYGTGD